jgi:hypothetical protein
MRMPQLSSVLIGPSTGLQSFAAPTAAATTVAPVTSVFGRLGAVVLTGADVTSALGYIPAGLLSPHFIGTPTAPTQPSSDNSQSIATTAFVKTLLAGYATDTGLVILQIGAGLSLSAGALTAAVTTVFGRTGDVVLAQADVITALGYTPITPLSPSFTGVPTAPTASLGDTSTTLATTAFVQAAIPIGVSITSAGAGLTLVDGTLSATLLSVFGRTGAVVLTLADIAALYNGLALATLSSPVFVGTPTAPTPGLNDNSTSIATTAYVQNVITTPSSLTVSNNIQYYGVLVASVAQAAVSAGSTINDATQISAQVTIIVSATSGGGVGFEAPTQDVEYKIVNRSSDQVLVYPPSTGIYASAQWEAQGAGVAVALPIGGVAIFILVSGLQGYVY